MKEVDQNTGEDLNPIDLATTIADANGVYSRDDVPNLEMPWMNPEMNTQSTNLPTTSKRTRVRLSTPERWELRQMQGGGAISQMEFPDFDEELGVLKNFDGK